MSNQASESLRTRVGKYELGRILGEGTFAKVRFARHVDTRQSVAIKIIDKEKVFRDKLVEQVNERKCLPCSSNNNDFLFCLLHRSALMNLWWGMEWILQSDIGVFLVSVSLRVQYITNYNALYMSLLHPTIWKCFILFSRME